MIEDVRNYIEKYRLIRPGDRVLAGVSGGADSVCLLEILTRLKEELSIEVAAVHVNHGLRRSAVRDEQFVMDLCRTRGIPLVTCHVDVRSYAEKEKKSLEEAARELRFQAFTEVMKETGANRLALAHHENDQAETILFHLIRGSGLRGLAGMENRRLETVPELSNHRVCKMKIVRPLLCVTGDEIRAFLKEQGIGWCEDETNAKDDADRNRIRHHVIPELEKIRPDAVGKISETGAYLGEVDAYFRDLAVRFLIANGKERGEVGAEAFGKLHPLEKQYVIMQLLKDAKRPLKDVSRVHIGQAAKLCEKQVGKKICLPGKTEIIRTYDGIRVQEASDEAPQTERTADASGTGVRLEMRIFPKEKGQIIPGNEYTKWFDYDKMNGFPVLRTRKEGDIFAVTKDGHKKLRRYLIDEKIPEEERDRILLAADGENILWVIGRRMSEAYKVTEETKQILEIRAVFPEDSEDGRTAEKEEEE